MKKGSKNPIRPGGVGPRAYWLISLFGVCVTLCFAGLAGWLWHIQVRLHERYSKWASAYQYRESGEPAPRGRILDASGKALAFSIPVKTVCADPSLITEDPARLAQKLSVLLDQDEAEILRRITLRLFRDSTGQLRTNRFAALRHNVSVERWRDLRRWMDGLGADTGLADDEDMEALRSLLGRALFIRDGYHRVYPNGSFAAHVLGHVSGDLVRTPHGDVYEDDGRAGLELTLDKVLRGANGWRSLNERITARAGLDVVLTIDAGLQEIAEAELTELAARYKPKTACAIVIRPSTGEILALANKPDFDPNAPREDAGWFNSAISGAYDPGSTFKIVTMSAALEQGAIRLEDTVDCENGRWRHPDIVALHDYKAFGILSYREVIGKSSNIGTAKAAFNYLQKDGLYQAVTNFGFLRLTGIPLHNEAPGHLGHPSTWRPTDLTRIAIGQGIQATPLQMSMAMSAIANGGVLYQPVLIRAVQTSAGRPVRVYAPRPLRRIMSEQTAALMVEALKGVVSAEGTAPKAALEHYTVAGKTGTAEQYINGTYKSGHYFSSFVGFFPADRPELCIFVGAEVKRGKLSHGGSSVAAPVFKAIAERSAKYIRLAPEIEPGAEPDLQYATRARAADQTNLGARNSTRRSLARRSLVQR